MDPMATHCRKLIVTGIYQANSYRLAFIRKKEFYPRLDQNVGF
jgi:hypothetical protein